MPNLFAVLDPEPSPVARSVADRPLADRLRPQALVGLAGQAQLLRPDAPLPRTDPPERLRALAVTSARIADNRMRLGGIALAAAGYGRTRTALRRVVAADPCNAEWQRDLSICWKRLASVGERQEARVGALAAWRQILSISQRLATSFPDSVEMQATPVIHLAGIARNLHHADAAALAEALAALDRALALLRPLAEAGRLDARRQG